MEITQTRREVDQALQGPRREGKKIGFVPTMGALHEGHLALVDAAKKNADLVVMSVFVNPTQFGPGEDLEKYPRNFTKDCELAGERGVDLVFHPEVKEIYPPGDQTSVVVTELTRGLCGPFRPGHFRGVTTVVAKLFNIVRPTQAFFGEKDYQQLLVIRRMVEDLRMDIEILGIPTVREESGLALSSRNQYLDEEEKKDAQFIFLALQGVRDELQKGTREVPDLLAVGKTIMARPGNIRVEYLEIVDPQSLSPLERVTGEARILTAVRLNGKRLIDNLSLIP